MELEHHLGAWKGCESALVNANLRVCSRGHWSLEKGAEPNIRRHQKRNVEVAY